MSDNVITLPPPAAKDPGEVLDAAIRVEFVRGLRRRGWTLEHAARECRCSRQTICNYITGKAKVSARAFCVVMGIAVGNDNRRVA